MRKLLSLGFVTFALAGPSASAGAADWTGLYLGGDLGARFTEPTWTTNSWTVNGAPCPLTNLCNPVVSTTNYALSNRATYNGSAFRFGAYGGFNWQIAPTWLAGIEGRVGSASKTVSQFGPAPGPMALIPAGFPVGNSDTTKVKTTWDSSIRARLGYLVTPSFLAYATAGPAWQRLELSASCGSSCPFSLTPAAAPVSASTSATKMGWTLGGGADVKAWGNWIARADYSYTHVRNTGFDYAYGTTAGAFAPRGVAYSTGLKLDAHTITAGLAYKF